jgi:hypothetical protein
MNLGACVAQRPKRALEPAGGALVAARLGFAMVMRERRIVEIVASFDTELLVRVFS